MSRWRAGIDTGRPFWRDHRSLLERLNAVAFPEAAELNGLLPRGARNEQGAPISFVPASRLQAVDYEEHIYSRGEVSTRENNWHDLFNALVWCCLPRLKSALNAAHHHNRDKSRPGRRGKMRDALTLFDESGVIVAAARPDSLRALSQRDWRRAFVTERAAWRRDLSVIVCGHALLEKFLKPYKSLTAHALLVLLDAGVLRGERSSLLAYLDRGIAERLAGRRLFDCPAGLSPLPLMGIPGWWVEGPQDTAFYTDKRVFRDPSATFSPAPVFDFRQLAAG